MRKLFCIVEIDESLDDSSFDNYPRIIFDFVSLRDLLVVRTYSSTSNYSTVVANMHEHFVEHLSPNVVEVNVHALGTVLLKFVPQILSLIIDGCISPDRFYVITLLV